MKKFLPILAALFCLNFHGTAAVLPAEKLLPDDTLMMFTIPDFAKSREIYKNAPQGQFWSDPSMKAFKDKFMGKLKSEYISPLEHDLGIHFDDYTSLPQGQFTLAMVQNGWQGKEKDEIPALLLLLDTKDKSSQLKSNLMDLKKKWVDAGKTAKTEKIRDLEFSVITLSSSDIPKSLKKATGGQADATEPADNADAKSEAKKQIYIGQAESLLIMGNSPKAIEKVLARMAGAPVKSLSELAAYDACHTAMFHDAVTFGWVNAKAFVDIFAHLDDGTAEAGSGPFPKPGKIMAAVGLNGLKTIAFNYRYSNEGAQFNVALGVPEASRTGIFKILAGEPKEYNPPAFVPADSVKFQRWRIDGQKAWATLRQMLADISPQSVGGVDFMLSSAEAAAKEKDPNFDIKKNLFGNLGDDMISYQKSPKGSSLAEMGSAPSLFLISSPNPEQLASALKSILALMGQQAGATDREFLGHKIYTIALPAVPGAKGAKPEAHGISYAFGGGYLAVTSDASMLEEYLRSSQNQGKSLRETPGLSEATQKVAGSGTYLFGFSNDSETMRVLFDVLTKDPNFGDLASLGPLAATLGSDFKLKDWVDVSLLPTFDKISKYFYFTVYGGNATPEGLNFKVFAPVPPQLKK
ncbi:MAG TPA: hypothetical protein VFC07_02325 [Verrucomicrobiae bacterium]|nr:hypothetical protein [Verrucomicrobiae bacterium]